MGAALVLVASAACSDHHRALTDAGAGVADGRAPGMDAAAREGGAPTFDVDATALGGDSGPGKDAAPGDEYNPLLCDGSTDVRFAVQLRDADGVPYSTPIGQRFMVVDGQCRYYVSEDASGLVYSGVLDRSEEDIVMRELGWWQLLSWAEHGETVTMPIEGECEGGATTSVTRLAHRVQCVCRCPNHREPGYNSFVTWALEAIDTWVHWATPLEGPVGALASPLVQPDVSEAEWPLDRPMAEIDGLISMRIDGPGARFEDPHEAAQLRGLRTLWAADPEVPRHVVEDGRGYLLQIRDELPEGLAEGVAALEASVSDSR